MPVTKYTKVDGTVSHQVRACINGRFVYIGSYPTAKAAVVAEAEAIKRGKAQRKRGMTLSAYRELWLADIHREAATISDYRTSIYRVEDVLGDVALTSIDERALDRLVRELIEHGYAPRTVRKTVKDLRALLSAAHRLGYAYEPAKPATLPRVHDDLVYPYLQEQVAAIIEAAGWRYHETETGWVRSGQDDYWRPLFILAASTGMRRGELLGVGKDDLDLAAKTVTLRKQVRHNRLSPLKTPAARRTIHLPDVAVEALRSHPIPPNDYGLVFPSKRGKIQHESNFSARIVRPIMLAAGLPEGDGLHQLRHTYASVLIDAGRSPKVLQTMLGHESVETTYNVYGHLFHDDWGKAADAIGDWLGSTNRLNNGESNSKESAGQPS